MIDKLDIWLWYENLKYEIKSIEKSDWIGLAQGYIGAFVMYFLLYYNPWGLFR